MKKLAIIIAILMAASSMSACSQAEKENYIHQKPTYSATADEAESRINTDIFGTETSETENAEKSPVSAFQEPSGVYPTSPNKAGVGQTSRKQDGVSESDGSTQNSESSVTQSSENSRENTPKQSGNSQSRSPKTSENPQSNPAPKPTQATRPKAAEAPKPKPTEAPKPTKAPEPEPTEPPAERKYLDYNQVVSNLIGYGQSLGMVYNGSLGIGNAGWFPPTDISGYTDTDAATAACYSDVDYVPYYYADLGAVPSDIMFNVVASGGQIYVVYG